MFEKKAKMLMRGRAPVLVMICMVFMLSVVMLVTVQAPWVQASTVAVRYVGSERATSGNCDNWTNACDLQYALMTASPDTEIWVSSGVYTSGASLTATFQLRNRVALYGGFIGNETQREQRNWNVNPTILSGDIDHNDIDVDGNNIDETWNNIQGNNVYHVVTGSGTDATAILDGFIITGGNANGLSPNDSGGGMYNDNGMPTIRHVTFSGNQAIGFEYGYGGGMYNNYSHPMLADVVFRSNRAAYGGGIRNRNNSNPSLINVAFRGNQATTAGGMMNEDSSNLTLVNVIFTGNWSVVGGAMYNFESNLTLTNVIISGNRADDFYGGAMYNSSSSPTLVNSIVWGNSLGQMMNATWTTPSVPIISYSDIEEGYTGQGNIAQDPQFALPLAASSAPFDAGDYRASGCSPTINTGSNAAVASATDLDGRPRILGGVTDMGTYETPLGICKTVTPVLDIPYHGIVTYTVALANYQDINETGTLVTDVLPTALDFGVWVNQPGDAQVNNNVITRSGVLTSETVLTYTFTAIHHGNYGDVVTNTANYSGLLKIAEEATFSVMPALTVEQAGNGAGVVVPPIGIHPYSHGTVVTLTAVANIGSAFAGWSGACIGSGDCAVIMNANKTVTATFVDLLQIYLPLITKLDLGRSVTSHSPIN